LPFENLTGDATKEYLGDGMAEELINTLSKIPGLRIPTRTSTFSYKTHRVGSKQIAKDLQVGTLLEGRVRSAGKILRISVQLSDPQSDSILWSQDYDRNLTDLFKLQDEVAKDIVQALQINLKGASAASVTSSATKPGYRGYTFTCGQGWPFRHRTARIY
jgi:adenylate cyclase